VHCSYGEILIHYFFSKTLHNLYCCMFTLIFFSRLSWIFLAEALSNMEAYCDLFTSGPEVYCSSRLLTYFDKPSEVTDADRLQWFNSLILLFMSEMMN